MIAATVVGGVLVCKAIRGLTVKLSSCGNDTAAIRAVYKAAAEDIEIIMLLGKVFGG